jgi:hypothetical protein
VDGVEQDDPPDIAEKRRKGIIGPDEVPEVHSGGGGEPDVSPEDAEKALGDEDWLATLPAREKLSGRPLKLFDADALTYRHLMAVRKSYADKARLELAAVRKAGFPDLGGFSRRVRFFLRIESPAQWRPCPPLKDGGCDGKGTIDTVGECPLCKGDGFLSVWTRSLYNSA